MSFLTKLDEKRLDEDFMFFMNMIDSYDPLVSELNYSEVCQEWLRKLCSKTFKGVYAKRNRNIFLANLILCLQYGKLTGPFENYPPEGELTNASELFNLLNENSEECDEYENTGHKMFSALNAIQNNNEPCLNSNEVGDSIDLTNSQCLKSGCRNAFSFPQLNEIPQVEPSERLLNFYDQLLLQISAEMKGKVEPKANVQINKFLEELIVFLETKTYETELTPKPTRKELLSLLAEKITGRREKVYIEETMKKVNECKIKPPERFDSKSTLPASLWEELINAPLSDYHMHLLSETYPPILIEKFVELLSNEKESIAMRLQNHQEKMLDQMRIEMSNENQKQNYEDIKKKYDHWLNILTELNTAKEQSINDPSLSDDSNGDNARLREFNKYIEADIEILHNQNKKLSEHGSYLTKEIKYMYDKCYQQEQKLQELNHANDHVETKLIKDIELLSQKIDEKSLQLQNLRSSPALDAFRAQYQ